MVRRSWCGTGPCQRIETWTWIATWCSSHRRSPHPRPRCTWACGSCDCIISLGADENKCYQGANSPAVADHAHTLGLGRAVQLCRLLEVLLAANAFGVAEACLSESINIAPAYSRSSQQAHSVWGQEWGNTHFRQSRSNAGQELYPAQCPIRSYGSLQARRC